MAERHSLRWLAGVVTAVLLGAGLTGCAKVPDSGPAVPVAAPGLSQSSEPADSGVNALLPRPVADAQVSVTAYLNALQTTHDPGRLGDLFLSSAVRTSFDQNPSMVVVRDIAGTVSAIVDDTTSAVFSGALVGTVGAAGTFVPAGGRPWQVQIRMVKQGGVWLFADPPPLVVTESQFGRVFNAVTVYFAATASTITGAHPRLLVPEQRYLNADAVGNTRTQIVDFVLAGPSDAISRVAHNPLPGIKRNSRVTLNDSGDLVIELAPAAESATAEYLNAFVAEVGWSLYSQFSGRVRLVVGGRPLDVPHFSSSQPQSQWKAYNPVSVDTVLPTYVIQAGAVKRSPAKPQTPRLTAPAASSRVHSAAVSIDGRRLATVRDDPAGGFRLWVADASGTLQPTLRAAGIGRPSWGGSTSTVVVPVGGRLFEVGVGNADRPTEVQVFAEGGRRLLNVTAVRISIDGLRALVIAGSGAAARLYVGTLTGAAETDGPLVMNAQRLAVEGVPRDVAWFGPVTAAVAVVSARNSVSVTLSPVDGSPALSRSAEAAAADPIRVAADPTYPPQPVLPLEIAGHLYALSKSAGTSRGGTGQAPFYPG